MRGHFVVLKKSIRALSPLLLLLALAVPSKAQLFLVTNRALLGADDSIDWGVLGAPFTVVAQPFNIATANGMNVNVSQTAGTFERRDQTTGGWAGNFAPSDKLLWDQGNGPVVTLVFGSLIGGVGAQIQADNFGPFTARIEAFDAADVSLGFFTEAGKSTPDGDNSAIFLGVTSASANIKKITYSLTAANGNPNDFAINKTDIKTSVVPEGDSLAMLACGGIPLMFLKLRSVRKRQRA